MLTSGAALDTSGGEIHNGMLLGSPARSRPMLFALDKIAAALKFQRLNFKDLLYFLINAHFFNRTFEEAISEIFTFFVN
jgi:hypothetical protein